MNIIAAMKSGKFHIHEDELQYENPRWGKVVINAGGCLVFETIVEQSSSNTYGYIAHQSIIDWKIMSDKWITKED